MAGDQNIESRVRVRVRVVPIYSGEKLIWESNRQRVGNAGSTNIAARHEYRP